MQQRLQLARILVTRPRLVLMDEPTGGLDVSVQAKLLALMRSLVRTLHLSVILVTHDIGVVRLLAHRLLVMKTARSWNLASPIRCWMIPSIPTRSSW